MTINVDNHSVRRAMSSLKALKAFNTPEISALDYYLNYTDEEVDSIYLGDENLNSEAEIHFTDKIDYIETNISFKYLCDYMYSFPSGHYQYVYNFCGAAECNEEDEEYKEIKQDLEQIKQAYNLNDTEIDSIICNAQQHGDISIIEFYNKHISKVFDLAYEKKINYNFTSLCDEYREAIVDNLAHYVGCIASVEKCKNDYYLGIIISATDCYGLHYCCYDLYSFYEKCLNILKEGGFE